jgi:LacI family transcriptional regulator
MDVWFSPKLKQAIVETTTRSGWPTAVWRYDWEDPRLLDLASWFEQRLAAQALPAAVFVDLDAPASTLIRVATDMGLLVPDQVAVVGRGNFRETCEFAPVALSSLDLGYDRLGYEGAHLLARILDGDEPPAEPVWLPGGHVVTRASTDTLAIEDPRVLAAITFMRKHVDEALRVEDVVRATATNRRTLERLFQQHFKHTIHDELTSCRIGRVKELLTTTTLSCRQIAAQLNYSSVAYMNRAFKRATGRPPGRYRREKQAPA